MRATPRDGFGHLAVVMTASSDPVELVQKRYGSVQAIPAYG
jgi:hypothetical protein